MTTELLKLSKYHQRGHTQNGRGLNSTAVVCIKSRVCVGGRKREERILLRGMDLGGGPVDGCGESVLQWKVAVWSRRKKGVREIKKIGARAKWQDGQRI
jgi:hypothetical protein